MKPIEILKAIKEDIRDKFDADPLMMRTVNLVITEFEARTERLHKHNVSNCADYEGFHEHLKEYEDNGIPMGLKDFIRLAKQYNCEIPKVVNGKLVFSTI